jgi:thioredoxin reductase (NADPH)
VSDHIEQADVVIVGGGPAGLTSALYAARAGLTPVCLEGYDSGGQMSRAVVVENFPGLPPEGVSGAELTDGIRNQAVHHGARILTDEVIAIDRDADERFAVRTAGGTIRARAVIMATGSAARELGVPGEEEYVGRGVAYCAICDGAFFAGKRVTVVGGGDAAVGEALALCKVACEVTLIHRRSTLRAGTASRSALERSDVHVRTPFIVEEIVGDEQLGVTGLKLRNLDEGSTTYHGTDGVFVSIGHIPASRLVADWVDLDPEGYIVTLHGSTTTRTPGIFAAGDVADRRYRQAITAAASGGAAAIDAEHWLLGAERAPAPADAGAR